MTATEEINLMIDRCEKNKTNPTFPKPARALLEGWKRELIINRSVYGDEATLQWAKMMSGVTKMMYDEYGKRKNI